MKILSIIAAAFLFAAAQTYTIGFAQDTLANDWRKTQVEEAKYYASKYEFLTLKVKDAKGSIAKQVLHIDEFAAQGVDFIITSPLDPVITSLSTKKALQKGVKVILLSRGIATEDYTAYITLNNRNIAAKAAEFIAKKLGYKGSVLMLEGVARTTVTRHRSEGFESVMQKYPNIKVIKARANYLRNEAIKVMEDIYEKNIAFDAIYSHSDSMLVGARKVMQKQGNSKDIITVGIDYIKAAREAILAGEQTASFTYPTVAKEGIEAIVDIINQKEVAKDMIIDSQMVTKENAKEIPPIF